MYQLLLVLWMLLMETILPHEVCTGVYAQDRDAYTHMSTTNYALTVISFLRSFPTFSLHTFVFWLFINVYRERCLSWNICAIQKYQNKTPLNPTIHKKTLQKSLAVSQLTVLQSNLRMSLHPLVPSEHDSHEASVTSHEWNTPFLSKTCCMHYFWSTNTHWVILCG